MSLKIKYNILILIINNIGRISYWFPILVLGDAYHNIIKNKNLLHLQYSKKYYSPTIQRKT